MKKKIFTLHNRGMNRDVSVSKAGETSVYENHNIRILARDNDTMLSVTNERGNKEIPLTTVVGTLIGWNVLKNHLILFTHDAAGESVTDMDRIYRVEYNQGEDPEFSITLLFHGSLGFDDEHPIESVVYFESENIQKIYWVDGINVLRMMNFMDEDMPWYDAQSDTYDNTYFDSNRQIEFGVTATIEKDNSGNPRPNGVAQYFLTYYNEHGQETGYAWVSDLVYLSPVEHGGSADGYNNNKITLRFENLDTRFSNFRVYSTVRTSYNGTVTAYIVADGRTTENTIIVDDNSHLTAIDATQLLYLGSQNVVPGTLTHKDQTLFLGDLSLEERASYTYLENAIRSTMFNLGEGDEFVPGSTWEASDLVLQFMYSNNNSPDDIPDIPDSETVGLYDYKNQLMYSSSVITTFKGGEKYRFGLVFRTKNGVNTDAFWIGDKVNHLYPVMTDGEIIRRVVVQVYIPSQVMEQVRALGFGGVQLAIAEADYSDRSIKAQGILNPTVFNVWNRKNNRLYGSASWLTRARGSNVANRHFDVVHNSNTSSGEIACNYWENGMPTAYYQLENYGTSNETYHGVDQEDVIYDYVLFVYRLNVDKSFGARKYKAGITAFKVKLFSDDQSVLSALGSYAFPDSDMSEDGTNFTAYSQDRSERYFSIDVVVSPNYSGAEKDEYNKKDLWNKLHENFESDLGISSDLLADYSTFSNYLEIFENIDASIIFLNPNAYPYYASYSSGVNGALAVARRGVDGSTTLTLARFTSLAGIANSAQYDPAYDKKHLMFVDENLVTLDSPEISHEAVSFDKSEGLQLRIVGVAKLTSCISDYIVDATHGSLAGDNLVKTEFSGTKDAGYIDGLVTWPLWTDKGLDLNSDKLNYDTGELPDKESLTYSDYTPGSQIVRYWLHMWEKAGSIPGFVAGEGEEGDPAKLNSKTFANLHFAGSTIYNASRVHEFVFDTIDDVRLIRDTRPQYMWMNVGTDKRYYSGAMDESLMMPRKKKYPIFYNTGTPAVGSDLNPTGSFFYSNLPVSIAYSTGMHAAISLHSWLDEDATQHQIYKQDILPYIYSEHSVGETRTADLTGAIVPWIDEVSSRKNLIFGEIPEFEMESADWEKNIITFSKTQEEPIRYSSFFEFWQNGISYFDSNEVYAVVKWRPHHTVSEYVYYVVDISNYSIDSGGNTITITGKFLGSAQENVAGTTIVVNYAEFESGSSVPVDTGIKRMDIGLLQFDDYAVDDYVYIDYEASAEQFTLEPNPNSVKLTNKDEFLFVGELFYDYDSLDPQEDPRYGGISLENVQQNKFIPAGPIYPVGDSSSLVIYGNQGDTYFQRWDDYRIKPLGADDVNNVLDVVSVMLETHINIDGRYDALRGTNLLASINAEEVGNINPVYSQHNNFLTTRDLDDDFNYGAYHSSITWTLEKHDMEQVDEWTHITLANNLALDGDKGYCRALRRFQNNIIAFQDKGIAEILFNSRTQISTTNGVPIEIANSGKVDGKRYITNKYGCINKWSIVEGKSALYFVDNINKAMLAFNEGIENLSTKFGFSVWFKRHNSMKPWTPKNFENFVAYYDRMHADVYLVGDYANEPCIVYNENLGAFTSFFDYRAVPMMVNVEDKFVSFGNHRLWLQNEGLYCNFFETQYDFWTTYRATPDPYGDKIWTNLEYRTDFYRTLDTDGSLEANESEMIDRERYLADETFDRLLVWNEYQQTNELDITKQGIDNYPDVRKDFRIWRLDIPRAAQTEQNPYGFDRIRNPWVHIRLKKIVDAEQGENQDLAQIHDVNVIYYE